MQYRPEIDGLRAVAVISVVLFHAKFPLFRGGFLGVDVFFVISGYLIASNIMSEGGQFSLARFYERRARRILPALLTVLLASSVAALYLLPPAPIVDFSKSLLSTLLFVANLYFWRRDDYFAEPSELTPLLHTWSLAVEEQFYVVFPLVLIALRGKTRLTFITILCAGIGSLLWAWTRHTNAPSDVFYLAQFRAWQLLAGAAIGWLELNHGRKSHGLGVVTGLLLIFAAIAIDRNSPALIGAIIATAGAAAIIYFGGPNFPSYVLGAAPLKWVGLISYSLYLWHQPIFVFARSYSIDALSSSTYIVLILLSAVLAWLSLRYIETPFRRKVPSRTFILTTGAAAGVAATFGAVAIASLGLPSRYTVEQLAILNASPRRGVAVRDGRPCRRPVSEACIIGDEKETPTFAILGDSHAEALTNAVSTELEKRNLSAVVLTTPACPLLLDAVEIGAPPRCAKHTQDALTEIRKRNIRNVIINERSAAYFLGPFDNGEGGVENEHITTFSTTAPYRTDGERLANVYASQADFIKTLLSQGMTVYYVFPIPEAGWHIPRSMAKAIASGRLPLTTNEARYFERNSKTLQLADQFKANGHFIPIYPAGLFCEGGRCKTHIGSRILYTDTDHLSETGAKIVAEAIASEIKGD